MKNVSLATMGTGALTSLYAIAGLDGQTAIASAAVGVIGFAIFYAGAFMYEWYKYRKQIKAAEERRLKRIHDNTFEVWCSNCKIG